MKHKKNEHKSLGHPLSTGSFSNNLKLMWKNQGIDIHYLLRALNILTTNLALLPFRTLEIQNWDRKIERVQIKESPVFILGHWRCGTTYLHNLFSRDTHFGYVSTLQAFCPDICIEGSKILQPIFKKLLPKKRPMDNMLMALDYPQEEEWALVNKCIHSFYNSYFYPRRMKSYFNESIIQNNSPKIISQWKEAYLKVLKKAALIMHRKQLIIKNPLNTVRIPILLDMFPHAKFIHIYRNPYTVYYSTVHLFKSMIKQYQFKTIEDDDLKEIILYMYREMMQTFWDTKDLIPSKNFTEVKFEDLEKNPIQVMGKIYKELQLPDFEQAREAFEDYIGTQSDYQKNSYQMDPETVQVISRRWKFIIDRLKYTPPQYPTSVFPEYCLKNAYDKNSGLGQNMALSRIPLK